MIPPCCFLVSGQQRQRGSAGVNSDIQRLRDEVSRLMAALEDVNFECQRLEIINKNLDFQLKEANRELRQNIAVLQAVEEENEELKKKLREQN